MLKNYLRTGLRVLTRHLGFSLINLVGLSIGIAATLLLMLFVRNETSFDGFHASADRIYRAWVIEDYGENQRFFNTTTPVPLAPTLLAAIPEVESAARYDRFSRTVRRGDTGRMEALFMVDESFMDMFDFAVIRGDRSTMLRSPESIVLTASAASRYFGASDPIGESLTIDFEDSERSFRVTGLLADVPENSSLQFEFLLSYSMTNWFYPAGMHEAWFNVSPETYVLLRSGSSAEAARAKLPAMVQSILADRVEPGQYRVGIQPLLDIHMNVEVPPGYSPVVNPLYVRILLAIAGLILAIACVNFVTLSMSRSVGRSKEIGVRKVIGAARGQLMGQYWGEAVILTGISVLVGLSLARLALPAFNTLAQRSLSISPDATTLLMILGLFLAVSLLAGLYPAVVLSGVSPMAAFRGGGIGRGDRSLFRKGLVVAQFGLSIALMASSLVMAGQMRYLQSKDLGFDQDSVLTIPTELSVEGAGEVAERLRFWAAGRSEVLGVTTGAMFFDANGWGRIGYEATDGSYRRFFLNVVDFEFVKTMGLRVVAGRDFDRNQPSDFERGILVNEAFAAAYSWDNPLRETIPGDFDPHEIVGVVENFNYQSLHSAVQPAVLVLRQGLGFSGASDFDYPGSGGAEVAVRIAGADVARTIGRLEAAWETIAPEIPFSYSFVDAAISDQYRQEARLSRMISLGTLLALFIAGLGLFGLAAMSVARRTKEIGLRQVLGAGAGTIVSLFAREFGLMIGVAFLVAAPFAWAGMDRWLSGFAYRYAPGFLPYVVAGAAAALVMFLAVGTQALRAARANPVDALRDE